MKNIMQKNILSLLLLIFVGFMSCKEDNSNGSILITIKSKGDAIQKARVYINAGTLENPNIQDEEFDRIEFSDSHGQVYIHEMLPDDYFIKATYIDPLSKKQVIGIASVTISERFRLNRYDLIIEMK
jgi:hypothetical protein